MAKPHRLPHSATPHSALGSSTATTAADQMDAGKPPFSRQASSADHDPTVDGAGSATFRLLLPQSFSDADTMDLYAAVNPLRRRTAALQVRVEPLDSSSPAEVDAIRVAVVLGPIAPVRRVEASSSSGESLALSPVQEALVAVVDAEGALHRADEAGRGTPGSVTCLLLVEAACLEAAAGRGVLGRIALEIGAVVRVVPWELDATSPRGQQAEEVIEITGDRSTVRKGLVVLSSCLQGDQPAGRSKSVKKEDSMLSLASSEMPEPSTGTFLSEASREHEQSSVPQFDCPQNVTGDVQTKGLQQISFRLLCPINIAGGLIGKKGLIIKGIEEETGACIDVSAPLSGCSERLITISALESPDSDYYIVQSAVLYIFDRMQEVESKIQIHDQPFQSSARALVLKSQYCCLVGLGGSIIKEMVNTTGAKIQILDESHVPACGSEFELVLQITGELMNVRDALCLVSWKLRNHIFSSRINSNKNGCVPTSNIAVPNATSQVNISSTGQYSTHNNDRFDYESSPGHVIGLVEKSFSDFQLTSSEVQIAETDNGSGINNSDYGEWRYNGINKTNNGIASIGENNLVRGVEPARITRITYETVISRDILRLVYADNGNKLIQLREITGAEVGVYDPSSEGNEATIVVSGVPDNAQSAQRLLVEFILQGQS